MVPKAKKESVPVTVRSRYGILLTPVQEKGFSVLESEVVRACVGGIPIILGVWRIDEKSPYELNHRGIA